MRRYCVHLANRRRRERADMSWPSAQRREKISEERADAFVAAMASHVDWKWHAPVDWESCPSSGGLMDVLLAEAGATGREIVVEVFRRDASGGGNLQNDRVLHLGFDRAQHNPIRDEEERGQ
jgi:hypothetical protein